MNKFITLALAAASVFTASAESFNCTASFAPYGQRAFSSVVGKEVKQATRMPQEIIDVLADNQVTSVNLYSPSQNNNTDPNIMTSATVFLTHNLEEEPFYTKNVSLSAIPYDLNKCEIDPYTIEAGKPLYVGWSVIVPDDNCTYLTYDELTPCFSETCFTKIGDDSWKDYSGTLGSLCIGMTVSGDNLPLYGAQVLERSSLPLTVTPGDIIPVSLVLRNSLAERINTLDIEYTVGNTTRTVSTSVECTSEKDRHKYLDHNDKGVAYFSIVVPNDIEGVNLPLSYTIAKVNTDKPNAFALQSTDRIFFSAIDASTGFDRNIVIEEATGTWCGFCPAGIVMMEKLAEAHPDGSLIRIGIHSNNGSMYRDPMQIEDYRPFINEFVSTVGFPSAFINREKTILPNTASAFDEVENHYNAMRAVKAPLKVEVSAAVTEPGKAFEITANVNSAYDFENTDDNYRLSFVIVEDHVGPYNQLNYFSTKSMQYNGSKLEGWNEADPTVRGYYFNDVASAIYGYSGIESSLPAEFSKADTHTFTLPAEFGIIRSPKVRVIAMILNTSANVIVNAHEYEFETGITGIDAVEARPDATDAPAEYFNLQGIRVNEPAKGRIYIVRRGNEVTKEILR